MNFRTAFLICATLLCALPGASRPQQAPPLVGAYGAFEPLDDEAKAVFQQATEPAPTDIYYTPMAVARQVVAGMNYIFEVDVRTRGGRSQARVHIFKPLSGPPRVTKVEHPPKVSH